MTVDTVQYGTENKPKSLLNVAFAGSSRKNGWRPGESAKFVLECRFRINAGMERKKARKRRRGRSAAEENARRGPSHIQQGRPNQVFGRVQVGCGIRIQRGCLVSGLVCDKEPHLRVRIPHYRRAVQVHAHGYSRAPAACCGRIRVRSQRNRHRAAVYEMSKMPLKRAYARPMALRRTPKEAEVPVLQVQEAVLE